MTDDLVLTIDAGTSGCKALLFDVDGREVGRHVEPCDSTTPRPSWAELRPDLVLQAVCAAVGQALGSVEAARVKGIGVSAQLGIVPVDRSGRPLANILTWMDKRAVAQAQRINETLGPEAIYSKTGRRVDPEWAACKILWLKDEQAREYAKTHRFLTVKDFIVHYLTGAFVMDETQASYSMLYNVSTRAWEEEFFQALDLATEKMPEVRPATTLAGELSSAAAESMGLSSGLPVFTGASDGTMATLGAGLVQERDAVNVVGTTDGFFVCTSQPAFDPAARTLVNCYAIPGLWSQGGPMSTTGGCLKWFCDNFVLTESGGSSRYAELDKVASSLPPGSEGLLCVPSLVGERTPVWDPDVRGAFVGLGVQHHREHLFRAILEGSSYGARRVLAVLQEQGVHVDRVLLVGGGAKSDLWAQIRADVFGKPVVRPKVQEATCLGTALIVGVGIGLYESVEAGIARVVDLSSVVEPMAAHIPIYDEMYARYVALHDKLR